MSGCFNGTQAHISKKSGRNIQYQRCPAHRGNIIIVFAENIIILFTKVLEVSLSLLICSHYKKRTDEGCL